MSWAREGPGESSFVRHDELGPVNPHAHDVRAGFGFEDHAGDAPFEVPHDFVRVLVDFAFGEDVDPAVAAAWVEGWGGEGVLAVGCVGEFGGGEGVAGWKGGGCWVSSLGSRLY